MSVSIEVDPSDYDRRITAVFLRNLPKLGHRFVEEAGKIMFRRWLEIINVKSGHMRDTSTFAVFNDVAVITTTSGYGRAVNDGYGPNRIEAKPGGVLMFEVDGKTLFRKWVNHPGYEGSHFIERTIEDTKEEVVQKFLEIYKEEVM